MTEMSSAGRSIWIVFGGVVFLLVLVVLFLMLSGSHLRSRWGKGHYSGSRIEAVSTFVVG